MAVATLERCYNNPNVFTGVVKIRKGETVRMILLATNIDVVKAIFSHFVSKVSLRENDDNNNHNHNHNHSHTNSNNWDVSVSVIASHSPAFQRCIDQGHLWSI